MSRVLGAALDGVEGVAIEVEVRISSSLPRVDVVGLPEAAVRESAARVRAAIASVGRPFPAQRVTVNLAPAELRKSGAGLDLAIALGILAAAGALEPSAVERRCFVGELALDGRLRGVRGALAMVLAGRAAGCREALVPSASAAEAALAPGIVVRSASDLGAVLAHLAGEVALPEASPPAGAGETPSRGACLSEVRGQERAKRALEIAAAGQHGLLFRGPPGSGKTMLAKRLPGLLPPLDFDEALEATRIHSVAGRLDPAEPVVVRRPFRAPHHSASAAGLLGGGSPPRPGEVSLAHRGVLFLDELPEFERRALESLRQVLEDRRVRLARARASCVFPADFLLIAACNPCPCGWHHSGQRDCRCDDTALRRYRARVSGPLLDRIDLHVSIPAVKWRDLSRPAEGLTSAELRSRVVGARQRQRGRSGSSAPNGRIPDSRVDEEVAATSTARRLLGRAVDRHRLSARGARRVMRVARSIADLAGEAQVDEESIAEALSYRDEGPEL